MPAPSHRLSQARGEQKQLSGTISPRPRAGCVEELSYRLCGVSCVRLRLRGAGGCSPTVPDGAKRGTETVSRSRAHRTNVQRRLGSDSGSYLHGCKAEDPPSFPRRLEKNFRDDILYARDPVTCQSDGGDSGGRGCRKKSLGIGDVVGPP